MAEGKKPRKRIRHEPPEFRYEVSMGRDTKRLRAQRYGAVMAFLGGGVSSSAYVWIYNDNPSDFTRKWAKRIRKRLRQIGGYRHTEIVEAAIEQPRPGEVAVEVESGSQAASPG